MSVTLKPEHSAGLGPLPLLNHEKKKISACNSDLKESVISVLGAECTLQLLVTHALPIVTLKLIKMVLYFCRDVLPVLKL